MTSWEVDNTNDVLNPFENEQLEVENILIQVVVEDIVVQVEIVVNDIDVVQGCARLQRGVVSELGVSPRMNRGVKTDGSEDAMHYTAWFEVECSHEDVNPYFSDDVGNILLCHHMLNDDVRVEKFKYKYYVRKFKIAYMLEQKWSTMCTVRSRSARVSSGGSGGGVTVGSTICLGRIGSSLVLGLNGMSAMQLASLDLSLVLVTHSQVREQAAVTMMEAIHINHPGQISLQVSRGSGPPTMDDGHASINHYATLIVYQHGHVALASIHDGMIHQVITAGADEDNDTVSSKADVSGAMFAIPGDSDSTVAGDMAHVAGNLSGESEPITMSGTTSVSDCITIILDGIDNGTNTPQTDVVANVGNLGGLAHNILGQATGTAIVKHSLLGAEGSGPVTLANDVAVTVNDSTKNGIAIDWVQSGTMSQITLDSVVQHHNTFSGVHANVANSGSRVEKVGSKVGDTTIVTDDKIALLGDVSCSVSCGHLVGESVMSIAL